MLDRLCLSTTAQISTSTESGATGRSSNRIRSSTSMPVRCSPLTFTPHALMAGFVCSLSRRVSLLLAHFPVTFPYTKAYMFIAVWTDCFVCVHYALALDSSSVISRGNPAVVHVDQPQRAGERPSLQRHPKGCEICCSFCVHAWSIFAPFCSLVAQCPSRFDQVSGS